MPMFSFNSSSLDGRVVSKIATKGDKNYISTAEPSPILSKSFSSSDAEEPDVWEEFYSYLKKESFWLNVLTNEVRWSDPKTPLDLWEEKYSQTYSRSYWKNHLTGETTWQNPRIADGEVSISSAPDSQRDRASSFMSPRSDTGSTSQIRAPITCSEPSQNSYHSQHADLKPSHIQNNYSSSQTLALSSHDRDSRRLSIDSVASSLTSLSRAESPGKRKSTREQLLGVTATSYSSARWSNRDRESMPMSPTSPVSPTSNPGIDRDFTGPNSTQRHSKGRTDHCSIPPPPPRAPPRPTSIGSPLQSPSHSQFQTSNQSPGTLKRTSSSPSLFARLCTPGAFPCAALSPTVRTYGGHSCAGSNLQRQVLAQAQIPTSTPSSSPSPIAMNKDGLLTAEDPNTGSLMVLVVDGHGFEGHRIAQYAESKFTKLLFGHPDWTVDMELAMADALEALEEGLLRGDGASGSSGGPLEVQRSGCAAVCAVLRGCVITVANIGDCGASVAYRNHSDSVDTVRAARLTVDHKPDLPGELRRIEEAGGRVYATVPGEAPQVFKDSRPLLGISRCLGSFDAKRAGVISEPEFSHYNLHENGRKDLALVLGSDGLWAFMSEKAVADVVVSVDNPNLAIDKLFRVATEKWLVGTNGMVDDITVCVVYLTYTG